MNQVPNTLPDRNRRALLRRRLRSGHVVRPPWALPEAVFLENCTRCDDCVKACQEKVLMSGDGGYPEIDFSRGGCALCGDCAEQCRAGAFQAPPRKVESAWTHRVSIKSNCMSLNSVVCRTCGDVCGEHAIRFQLKVGGAAAPLLDISACTGCGECIALCPVQAIQVDFSEIDHLGGSPDA